LGQDVTVGRPGSAKPTHHCAVHPWFFKHQVHHRGNGQQHALAGAALVVRAPASKLPHVFEVAGWVLVGISVLILLAPIRWHGSYGAFWIKRLTPGTIRLLSPVPAVVGAGLIYAAV
jgi:hypothetical protein